MIEKFKQYEKLRGEIFEYFKFEGWDVGMDFKIFEKWRGDKHSVRWESEGDIYSEEVLGIFPTEEYTMFLLRLSTGEDEISIFKNSNFDENLEDE